MKSRIFTIVALLPLALTAACSASGSADVAPSSEASSTAVSASPSPSSTKAVPDVIGIPLADAVRSIEQWGFKTSVEYDVDSSIASKAEVEKYLDNFVVYDQAESFSMSGKPNVILWANPSEEFESKFMMFTFQCSNGEYGDDGIEGTFYSLESVWKSIDFKDYTECNVEAAEDAEWKPTKEQARIAKIANKHWEGDEEPALAYAKALEYCAVPQLYEEDWASTAAISKPWLEAASEICKDAPFYKTLKAWAEGTRVGDGTHEVGTEMATGTYRSDKKVSDCYWSRLTTNGAIIANDFVSYAAAGVIVTVRKGEVFEAKDECGIWTKQ